MNSTSMTYIFGNLIIDGNVALGPGGTKPACTNDDPGAGLEVIASDAHREHYPEHILGRHHAGGGYQRHGHAEHDQWRAGRWDAHHRQRSCAREHLGERQHRSHRLYHHADVSGSVPVWVRSQPG